MLRYETILDTILGGIRFKPNENFELSLDAAVNSSQASLDPFRLPEGEAFAASRPNQSYDFSRTHTFSDLDTTIHEIALTSKYRVNERTFLTGGYRYLDYEDDAPYLYNTSGSVSFYNLGVGWLF